jgi:hypothetical protein
MFQKEMDKEFVKFMGTKPVQTAPKEEIVVDLTPFEEIK